MSGINYEKVSRRIEKVKQNNENRLDLNSCELREIPKEVLELKFLKFLDLSDK